MARRVFFAQAYGGSPDGNRRHQRAGQRTLMTVGPGSPGCLPRTAGPQGGEGQQRVDGGSTRNQSCCRRPVGRTDTPYSRGPHASCPAINRLSGQTAFRPDAADLRLGTADCRPWHSTAVGIRGHATAWHWPHGHVLPPSRGVHRNDPLARTWTSRFESSVRFADCPDDTSLRIQCSADLPDLLPNHLRHLAESLTV